MCPGVLLVVARVYCIPLPCKWVAMSRLLNPGVGKHFHVGGAVGLRGGFCGIARIWWVAPLMGEVGVACSGVV